MRHDWCNGTCETCPEDPAALKDQPIGMYHCPGCDMMLLAGSSSHGTCAGYDCSLAAAADAEREASLREREARVEAHELRCVTSHCFAWAIGFMSAVLAYVLLSDPRHWLR
jgi:hypothetical protein